MMLSYTLTGVYGYTLFLIVHACIFLIAYCCVQAWLYNTLQCAHGFTVVRG